MTDTTIVLATDQHYVQPMLVTLSSLAVEGGPGVAASRLVVLHPGLPREVADRIHRVGAALGRPIELVTVEDDLSALPVTDWISSAAYLRLLLDRAAGDSETVVYLDSDLLVVDDVGELFGPPPPHVAAVLDVSNPRLDLGEALPGHQELGLPGDRAYFNSGVMRVNVRWWREDDVAGRCLRFLTEQRDHVRFWDQDALNVVVDDQWVRLPLEYNVYPLAPFLPAVADVFRGGPVISLDEVLALEPRAHILHFAGPAKPWRPQYPDHPVRDRYRLAERQLVAIES